MKTKRFLLCTSGTTVDGRNINPDWLRQAAKNYNPKTYGARLDIEHIKGVSPDGPFRAYGDVLELSVEEDYIVELGMKTEKRTALFGVFDVTEEAKKLNAAGQKVYPSAHFQLDFAETGEAYMIACALTDTPAALATEKLQFNRHLPGIEEVKQAELGALIEFADDEGKSGDVAAAVTAGFATLIEKLGLKKAAPAGEPEKPADPETPAAFDAAAFAAGLGETLGAVLAQHAEDNAVTLAQLRGEFAALKADIETTEAPGFTARPKAAGASGGRTRTDC